jgi:uncharacterized protein
METPDVNVLVYAHRIDAVDHDRYRRYLEGLVNGPASFGLIDLVLSGFLRVVTHPRIFKTPTPLDEALGFVSALRARPNAVRVGPGARHWDRFTSLVAASRAKGNLVADAYLAALAIESGNEWITTDRDYARFPGLRWRHPLE